MRCGGLLLISIRAYDEARRTHPPITPPQVSTTDVGPVISFQLWDWHSDGERYDPRHFQLVPVGYTWDVRVRRTTYWALTHRELTALVAAGRVHRHLLDRSEVQRLLPAGDDRSTALSATVSRWDSRWSAALLASMPPRRSATLSSLTATNGGSR